MSFTPPDLLPPWMVIARGEMGVIETPGPASTKRILEYHASTLLRATEDRIPWCSAFACWCMEKALGSSPKSARAFDWMNWGYSITKPVLGCAVVLKRGENNGHVGFLEYETELSVALLGGNQGDAVNITRFAKDRVVGLRMPPENVWKPVPPVWRPPLKYPQEPAP